MNEWTFRLLALVAVWAFGYAVGFTDCAFEVAEAADKLLAEAYR